MTMFSYLMNRQAKISCERVVICEYGEEPNCIEVDDCDGVEFMIVKMFQIFIIIMMMTIFWKIGMALAMKQASLKR